MNNLFVYGCSYATGEELLAHELGSLDDYRIATADDPRKFFKRLEKEHAVEQYEEIKRRQYKLAWPQILADKLGLECLNRAESGNSLDKMLYQLYEDIYQENISEADTVVISLTKATRNAVFNKTVESFQLPSLYWPVKTLMGVKDTGDMSPVINEDTDKALLEWFTDDRVAWDFIKNLQAIKNISQFFNVKIIPCMHNNIVTSIPLLTHIYHDCNKGFITDKGLDDFAESNHAWGHPTQSAHTRYAEHLYEILR